MPPSRLALLANNEAPPYRAATAVAALVLLGYVLTLAPTVTFWDAGEFIAATKTLGIPHPPGTPLFVLIAHVWAAIVPFGEYALRTNLLSALCSAAAAGLFFLILHEALRSQCTDAPRWLVLGGPAAAAVTGAFTFTQWQNSNETEVYAVATFTIAAMSWLAVLWRRERGTPRAPRLLLLIVYLAGLSVGNHLLALLAGPGIILFLVTTLRHAPAPTPNERRRERGAVAIVAGTWALLIGIGLGNEKLSLAGAAAFVAATLFALWGGAERGSDASPEDCVRVRRGGIASPLDAGRQGVTAAAIVFAALSLALVAIAVTLYLFTYLRAAQHPAINEAAPTTPDALLAVIRRTQYPVRTPLDDPTRVHDSANPGRSLTMLAIQLADYIVYFSWQWARSIPVQAVQVGVTLVFLWLGMRGIAAHRRADRGTWWLLLGIFAVTGLGLVLYMNFKPGYSRWFDLFPRDDQHEVRERDYFFVVSFVIWGLWAGLGLATVAATLARRSAARMRIVAPAVLLAALLPVALNWRAASRRGADKTLAADVAYDLLNSVPPYGILFTYGDNDTFPLWWAQEVEGIRRDVTVVCLALANTDWYMRQLRDHPTRPLDATALPAVWRARIIPRPTWPLHALDDTSIAAALAGFVPRETQDIPLGPITRRIQAGTLLYPNDLVALDIVRENIGRRPIVWSVTTGRDFLGLGRYVVQRGLGFELLTTPADTSAALGFARVAGGPPIDMPTTERLLWDTYRYGGLYQGAASGLESTARAFASTLALPFTQLAYAYHDRAEWQKVDAAADRAIELSPQPALRAALAELRLKRN